jgi:CopA family copper-resistance protein
MKALLSFILLFFSVVFNAQVGTNGQSKEENGRPIKEYQLTISKEKVTLAGVSSKGMTINGSVPGPTLEFNEGDLAVIHVTNTMDVETSIHWHGIILPNFQDGIPYITTPPIAPGSTFTYRIPINQSGTYWYHSHTMLQEQKGVYGSILIHPKEKTLEYDADLVVVLSDWTNQKAEAILKNLKRGSEWYQIKKGTAVPLGKAIAEGGFKAQMKMWRDRMNGADIADIYYPTFLANGQKIAEYPNFKEGQKIRVRFINAAASTYFWVDFGGGNPMLVSADGVDVKPVSKDRFLFAIAETYDFIVTVPKGKLEITATAQDGSGHTSIHLGSGELFPAKVIAKPDKVEIMKSMAKMDMKMGAPALKNNAKKYEPEELSKKYGMKMDMNPKKMTSDSTNMDHQKMDMSMHHMAEHHNSKAMNKMKKDSVPFNYEERKKYFNYNFLEAQTNTDFDKKLPVTKLLLNLTGNMNRYVWSFNGIPLSEADKIKIKKGEITQITFNNLTMMHHPMHLHGHYFRVINSNGEKSPLKHTVNVAPMQKVTIEFLGEEYGDWFFHCHILYHMMGGMTRIFSYNTPRDERMKNYPEEKIIKETNPYYFWGLADIGSHFTEINTTYSNIRNEWNVLAEYGYEKDFEATLSYNRYINDWVRLYAGVNTENKIKHDLNDMNTVGKIGVKYFTPYMFNLDINMDSQLRTQIKIDKEFMLFKRFFILGEYEYTADFGWGNQINSNFEGETKYKIGFEYMFAQYFSFMGNYHNLYGWGAGITTRF